MDSAGLALEDPAATEADVWNAIDALAGSEHWRAVLDLIEKHEFDLDPWRMAPLRVRALIELGWRGRALEHLVKAYRDGYVRGNDAVERLVGLRALAVAASFVAGSMAGDLWREDARATVLAAAARACAPGRMEEAPLEYADAIQAQDILSPGTEQIQLMIGRALRELTVRADRCLADDDPAGATLYLTAAARLEPEDRSRLDALAHAAHRAGLTERYLDTQLRIWTTHRDASALLAAARGILETGGWATIFDVMSIAAAEADLLGGDFVALAEAYLERACGKIDDHIRDGDVASALGLLITVSAQFPIVPWPHALLSRLLRATKRRLRSQRDGEALISVLGPRYLQLAPLDPDIGRMVARLRVRQRRLEEARALLERVVAICPHVAGDWMGLAMVQNEMDDLEARDLSVIRAILIAPETTLPPALASVRERLALI